jgi:hypothetical protein
MKLVSLMRVAIKKGGKYLVVSRKKPGLVLVWGLPSEEFSETLNGNLEDTLKRMLKKISSDWKSSSGIEYLGSYIQKIGGKIVVGYDFLIENFEGVVEVENFRWLETDDFTFDNVGGLTFDENTENFFKLNSDVI